MASEEGKQNDVSQRRWKKALNKATKDHIMGMLIISCLRMICFDILPF